MTYDGGVTGHPLLDLLVSIVGVALLYGVLVRWGAKRDAPLPAEEARRRLAAAGVGGEVAVDRDGRGAVAVDGGRAGVLVVLGDQYAVRVTALPVDARAEGDTLAVDLHDLGFPPVRLRVPDAAAWAGRLGRAA